MRGYYEFIHVVQMIITVQFQFENNLEDYLPYASDNQLNTITHFKC